MNAGVEIGAIRICSIVPFSFSRTMESAVETTAVIIEMYAMRPGTRKSVLRSSGLYQMRGSMPARRSEEHTSELQSQSNLVCRLLLEKKNVPHDRLGAEPL